MSCHFNSYLAMILPITKKFQCCDIFILSTLWNFTPLSWDVHSIFYFKFYIFLINCFFPLQRVIEDEIKPAFLKLSDFIQTEYYPHLRRDPGIGSLPNGQNMYKVIEQSKIFQRMPKKLFICLLCLCTILFLNT